MSCAKELEEVEQRWEAALEGCMNDRADAWAEIGRQRQVVKQLRAALDERDGRIAELEAENARLRKVVDAAVAYMTTEGETDPLICALDDAVREYRKELPQNYHSNSRWDEPEPGQVLTAAEIKEWMGNGE